MRPFISGANRNESLEAFSLGGWTVLHDRLKTARVGRPNRRRNESILRSQATSSPEGVGKGQDTVVDLHHMRKGVMTEPIAGM